MPGVSPTANKRVLIATAGFDGLGLVTPDYVIPNGFLRTDGGTLNFAGVDLVTYASLPTDGVNAINRNGAVVQNRATNFAGVSASVSSSQNTRGAEFPGHVVGRAAGVESGWGVNFAHQGDVIFATWFTHDLDGKAWNLSVAALQTAANHLLGAAIPGVGAAARPPAVRPHAGATVAVGTATLTFSDGNNGTFAYTVNGISADQGDHPPSVRDASDVCLGRAQ
jgi:hypothetical protein